MKYFLGKVHLCTTRETQIAIICSSISDLLHLIQSDHPTDEDAFPLSKLEGLSHPTIAPHNHIEVASRRYEHSWVTGNWLISGCGRTRPTTIGPAIDTVFCRNVSPMPFLVVCISF